MSTESPAAAPTPTELAEALPVLALPDVVLFPGAVVPIDLKNAALAGRLGSEPHALVAVFVLKNGHTEGLSAAAFHPIGALARVVRVIEQPSGATALVHAVARAQLESLTATQPFLEGKVCEVHDIESTDDETQALTLALRQAVHAVLELLRVPPEFVASVRAIEKPGALADLVAARMDIATAERAELLATLDVKARVRALLPRLARRLELLMMQDSIDAQVQSDVGKARREHVLRQQMYAIERELGENDDEDSHLVALEKRLEAA